MPGHLEWRQLYSGEWVQVYVEDSPIASLVRNMLEPSPPDPGFDLIKLSILLVVIVLVLVVSLVIGKDYLESGAYKSKVTSQSLRNGTTSTWDGDEFQYNLDGYSRQYTELCVKRRSGILDWHVVVS